MRNGFQRETQRLQVFAPRLPQNAPKPVTQSQNGQAVCWLNRSGTLLATKVESLYLDAFKSHQPCVADVDYGIKVQIG
jgi:hypothetical protein